MRRITFVSLSLLALLLISPLLMRMVFFRMPAYSATFDCDDGTLLMMERFENIGITSTPILGNLKATDEQYGECDHVWLLADMFGRQLAFDRGVYYSGGQHYEGYLLSKEELLEFVAQDMEPVSQTVENPAGP